MDRQLLTLPQTQHHKGAPPMTPPDNGPRYFGRWPRTATPILALLLRAAILLYGTLSAVGAHNAFRGFRAPDAELRSATLLDRRSLQRARAALKAHGLIDYLAGDGDHATYSIPAPEPRQPAVNRGATHDAPVLHKGAAGDAPGAPHTRPGGRHPRRPKEEKRKEVRRGSRKRAPCGQLALSLDGAATAPQSPPQIPGLSTAPEPPPQNHRTRRRRDAPSDTIPEIRRDSRGIHHLSSHGVPLTRCRRTIARLKHIGLLADFDPMKISWCVQCYQQSPELHQLHERT